MGGILRVTTVLLLVLSLGLHWALLQTVAWTGMAVSYSQGASLTEAIAKTFDGKHPCRLCSAIQKGRDQEQKQRQEQQSHFSLKLDLAVIWQPTALPFVSPHQFIPSQDIPAYTRSDPPLTPPPRLSWSTGLV